VPFFDWSNLLIGGGAAVFSGSAAITSQVVTDKAWTAVLAGIGALCAFVNSGFKLGSRYARQLNCKLDMDQAMLQYQSDPALDEKWLAEQFKKALDRIRENQ
jgi:hypothetical protein